MMKNSDCPRIYIGDLATKTVSPLMESGLAGDMDCSQDEQKELLRASPVPGAEEYPIHD